MRIPDHSIFLTVAGEALARLRTTADILAALTTAELGDESIGKEITRGLDARTVGTALRVDAALVANLTLLGAMAAKDMVPQAIIAEAAQLTDARHERARGIADQEAQRETDRVKAEAAAAARAETNRRRDRERTESLIAGVRVGNGWRA